MNLLFQNDVVQNSTTNTTYLSNYGNQHIIFSSFCGILFNLNLHHVIIFSVFALFGFVGNVMLLSVILRTAGLQNAPNILLINITVADILYMAIAAPFGIRHELTPCWLFGLLACQFKHYLPLVAQAACIFSLAALSRERYNAIVRGLESRISRSTRRTLVVVAATWVLGIIIASPVFWITRTSAFGLLCQYVPMNNTLSQIFIVSQFVLLYIIPLAFISVNYALLARSLCKSTTMSLVQNQSAANPIQARKRLAQIVLVITFLFGTLWFPYYVYFLWFVFNKEGFSENNDFSQIRFFRHLYYYMSLANSCLNPWVVFVMSSAHRRSLIVCVTRSKVNRTNFRKIAARRISSNNSNTASSKL